MQHSFPYISYLLHDMFKFSNFIVRHSRTQSRDNLHFRSRPLMSRGRHLVCRSITQCFSHAVVGPRVYIYHVVLPSLRVYVTLVRVHFANNRRAVRNYVLRKNSVMKAERSNRIKREIRKEPSFDFREKSSFETVQTSERGTKASQ